jgi:acyl-homoserine lactone acylase PvdQ
MKKLFILAAMISALAFSSVAFADNPAGINYDTLHTKPADNAQCGTAAGSGSFAAFGNFGTVHDLSGGADGYQTGLNNSAVCGNR